MPDKHIEARPGFQGSETSWMEATFYRHGDDPIVITGDFKLPVIGRRQEDVFPGLLSANTTKALGSPSGSWVLQMKPSKVVQSLFDDLVDDDWVDIVVYRHDQPWHVMRGLIDEVRRAKSVGGTGATTEIYTVTGRDFGKIWEITPVWFSPYANDIVTAAVANKVFAARPEVLGNPGQVVWAYMRSFMEQLATEAGPNWEPPRGMPGMEPGTFIENVMFQVLPPFFQNKPPRKAFNPQFMQPQGTLWSLAQQFCDPMFTEMYVDLLPNGYPWSPKISAGDSLKPEEMVMTVVCRDKPFPVTDFALTAAPPAGLGYEHTWNDLPVITIPRQQIVHSDLGRSGLERFNAYFVATSLHQELYNANVLNIIAPLLDRESMKRHGFRRMDVQSNMAPDETALEFSGLAESQRRLLRDWYVLNPYMLNGSINLGIGRPDAKIGCRARVPATQDEKLNVVQSEESYYIEQVSHAWTFGTSVKTSLGVTRGWRGDDASYIAALDKQSQKYEVPQIKTDKESGNG